MPGAPLIPLAVLMNDMTPSPRPGAAVVARGLVMHYPREQRPVLAGLDLVVEPGRFVAILGRSGSGKSTLLNLLGAMEPPQQGSLAVAGRDLQQLDEAGRTLFRRQHLGFVFQSFNLIPVLDVRANVGLPLALNGVRDEFRVDELLTALGIAALASRYPEALSGGEQQRVAIARALVHRPALVMADEPTGNLDQETSRDVVALMREVLVRQGTTLIMATHSEEAADAADEVFRLVSGRLERQR